MYSNNTKSYYNNVESTSSYTPYNNSSSLTYSDTLFVNIAISLITVYNKNNMNSYNKCLDNLRLLQKSNPNYKNSIISNTVSNLITALNNMLNVNTDLNKQLIFLENNDLYIINNDRINISSKIITQDTKIKLVYVQYLLMYNISSTNGIFITEYLNNAQRLLNINKGKIDTNIQNYKY